MNEHYSNDTERSWWTDQRREIWRTIDDATKEVTSSYEPERRLLGGLSLHVCAPNPNGINADISPDEWYVTLPYEEGRVDMETIASLLSDELETSVTIQPRSDEWEPGFWLIIENAERSVDTGSAQSRGKE